MDEFAKKVTEYQVFNFLLPGTVFSALVTKTTSFDMFSSNIVVALFGYYFVGLIISRIGSIIIGPTLKKLKIIRFESYTDFLKASKTDDKINVLSQENNVYRTLISMLLVYLLVYLVSINLVSLKKHFTLSETIIVGTLFLVCLFIFAYRKQTGFISKRIKAAVRD